MYRKLSTLLLSSLILVGCVSRMSHDEDPQRVNHEDVYPVIQTFVKGLTTPGDTETFMSVASLPFWVDDWITEEQVLREEIPNDNGHDFPGYEDIRVRVYPFDDLSVLLPDVWEKLKSSPRLYLKDLYVGVVAVQIKGAERLESGYVLLRHVDGKWKIAGLIER